MSLERAFTESVAQPKKRTREEILRDLKSKRGADGPTSKKPAATDEAFVEAKNAGKFKPIGFKAIGSSRVADGKTKRKKKVKAGEPEENGERKKKRKVAAATAPATAAPEPSTSGDPAEEGGPSTAATSSKPIVVTNPELEPVDEDFDIFAGAGEYTGLDLGDDDEGSDDGGPARPSDRRRQGEEEGEVRGQSPSRPGKWLVTSDDERDPTPPPPPAREAKSENRSESSPRRPDRPHRPASDEEEGEMNEEERPMRLQPLSSSMVPSIKDLLAASDEAEKAEKRKARKEKKKAAGGGSGSNEKDTKAKVDRDYQK